MVENRWFKPRHHRPWLNRHLVTSCRASGEKQVPLPSLLCSGAVHQALVKQKLRTKVPSAKCLADLNPQLDKCKWEPEAHARLLFLIFFRNKKQNNLTLHSDKSVLEFTECTPNTDLLCKVADPWCCWYKYWKAIGLESDFKAASLLWSLDWLCLVFRHSWKHQVKSLANGQHCIGGEKPSKTKTGLKIYESPFRLPKMASPHTTRSHFSYGSGMGRGRKNGGVRWPWFWRVENPSKWPIMCHGPSLEDAGCPEKLLPCLSGRGRSPFPCRWQTYQPFSHFGKCLRRGLVGSWTLISFNIFQNATFLGWDPPWK